MDSRDRSSSDKLHLLGERLASASNSKSFPQMSGERPLHFQQGRPFYLDSKQASVPAVPAWRHPENEPDDLGLDSLRKLDKSDADAVAKSLHTIVDPVLPFDELLHAKRTSFTARSANATRQDAILTSQPLKSEGQHVPQSPPPHTKSQTEKPAQARPAPEQSQPEVPLTDTKAPLTDVPQLAVVSKDGKIFPFMATGRGRGNYQFGKLNIDFGEGSDSDDEIKLNSTKNWRSVYERSEDPVFEKQVLSSSSNKPEMPRTAPAEGSAADDDDISRRHHITSGSTVSEDPTPGSSKNATIPDRPSPNSFRAAHDQVQTNEPLLYIKHTISRDESSKEAIDTAAAKLFALKGRGLELKSNEKGREGREKESEGKSETGKEKESEGKSERGTEKESEGMSERGTEKEREGKSKKGTEKGREKEWERKRKKGLGEKLAHNVTEGVSKMLAHGIDEMRRSGEDDAIIDFFQGALSFWNDKWKEPIKKQLKEQMMEAEKEQLRKQLEKQMMEQMMENLMVD